MPSLGLIFEPPTPEWPTSRAWIGVRTMTENQGRAIISPECVSAREVEAQVELLRQELEAILAEAVARFDETEVPD